MYFYRLEASGEFLETIPRNQEDAAAQVSTQRIRELGAPIRREALAPTF